MIRICTSYAVLGNRSLFALSSWHLNRRLYSQVAINSDGYFHSMKWDETLAEKAKKLIFSERQYPDFSKAEKKIVDAYQKKLLEVDGGVILPNTGADFEQREIEQLIAARRHKN